MRLRATNGRRYAPWYQIQARGLIASLASASLIGKSNGATMSSTDASSTTLLGLYRTMSRIRAFEDAAEVASRGGLAAWGPQTDKAGDQPAQVRGPLHLSTGQEAVPTGVCAHLRADDPITSTHRGHGHTLAKGADLTRMMMELFGKAGGFCGGRGGSMHIADFSVGMLGANGVVAASIPIAVGAAHALRLQGRPAIAAAFFGDGAINRGPFAESLNWAAAYGLPVLFVCEDNQWSATTRTDTLSAGAGAAARARAYGIEAVEVDGNDVEAVYAAAADLSARVREQSKPALLHARTYRFKGHVSVDPAAYRDPAELARALERDPLLIARERLTERGVSPGQIEEIDRAARDEVKAALAAAAAADWPHSTSAFEEIQSTGAGTWL
jgi:TPP-dependent pyruvate/acetoin dehydrogenase alpha subunit